MMLLTLAILFLECRWLPHLYIGTDETDVGRADPVEGGAPAGVPVGGPSRTWRAIPLLAGVAFVVGSGVVDGLQSDRWSVSEELRLAASRLDGIPLTIGEWRGRAEPVDPRSMMAAGLQGCLMRHYENARTGRTISLLLACGRPGLVFLHTPEGCYPGAGYEMVQAQPEKFALPGDRHGEPAGFLRADFDRTRSFPRERLRICWAWKATGPWSVPSHSRFTFAARPFLYKLYLIYRPSWGRERAEDDSYSDFLRQLLPALDRALAPAAGAAP
jgi:hypothetical protein